MIDLGNTSSKQRTYELQWIDSDLDVQDLARLPWDAGSKVVIEREWNGSVMSKGSFEFSGLWTKSGLFARFVYDQNESFVISDSPNVSEKALGLWERDVCEIFIAPDRNEPRKYFEFEVAPTGEWLDLEIDMTSGERVTDWAYSSGMEASARIDDRRVTMAMKIPWEAFGREPKAGDVWLGNIFRCVGKEPDRGYLAWQPTMTEKPNFHVPEAFGEFYFA